MSSMADTINPVSFYPSTPAAEEQSAAVRDPIVDPRGNTEEPAGELTFSDVLDILNPLQHIPVVSSVYRAVTGDKIAQGPQLAGDLLFGGPAALISAGARALFEEAAGVKMDTMVANLLGTEETAETPNTAVVAAAEKAPATPETAPAPSEKAPAAAEKPPVQVAETPPETGNAAALAALARDLRGLSRDLVKESRPNADTNARAETSDQAPPRRTAPTEAAAAPHPNLPPAGASPEWVAQAMERALVKYHNAARTGAPAAHPLSPSR